MQAGPGYSSYKGAAHRGLHLISQAQMQAGEEPHLGML